MCVFVCLFVCACVSFLCVELLFFFVRVGELECLCACMCVYVRVCACMCVRELEVCWRGEHVAYACVSSLPFADVTWTLRALCMASIVQLSHVYTPLRCCCRSRSTASASSSIWAVCLVRCPCCYPSSHGPWQPWSAMPTVCRSSAMRSVGCAGSFVCSRLLVLKHTLSGFVCVA